MSELLLECRNLTKTYHDGLIDALVFDSLNLKIHQGESLAIIGPSGAGKSTLLHLLGGLDNPSTGEVLIRGKSWQTLSEEARCRLRNKTIGFVYQFHHLLPEFSALENVAMSLLLSNAPKDFAYNEATLMLQEVGLSSRLSHKPSQLSGGERQRVAIARALVHRPACLLADEPTGNLDRATAMHVFDMMLDLNRSRTTTLVVVTHDRMIADKLGSEFLLE